MYRRLAWHWLRVEEKGTGSLPVEVSMTRRVKWSESNDSRPLQGLLGTGLSLAVMAWMPWSVPARTRYSLEERRPLLGMEAACGWVKCSD